MRTIEPIVTKLQPFFSVPIKASRDEEEEETYEIRNGQTGELVGYFLVNRDGDLESFHSSVEKQTEPRLKRADIEQQAEAFLDAFYPNRQGIELYAFTEINNAYLLSYKMREAKHGLFLPNSGYSLELSLEGDIRSFNRNAHTYKINYTDQLIDSETALQQFLDALSFELTVLKVDQTAFQLVYQVNEQLLDIPIDGTFSASLHESFLIEERVLDVPKSELTLYEQIGITSAYQLLGKQVMDGRRVELWSRFEIQSGGYSFELEAVDAGIIKLAFDQETGTLLQVSNWETSPMNRRKIGLDQAREKAIALLQHVYPRIKESMRIEAVDKSIFEDDDEQLTEPTVTFYFHYFHNGVRVDQAVSYCEVSRSTGKIIYFLFDNPPIDQLNEVQAIPSMNEEEAKTIYTQQLEMELRFVGEWNQDGVYTYSLSYIPAYSEQAQNADGVDAHSGKFVYVKNEMSDGDVLFVSDME